MPRRPRIVRPSGTGRSSLPLALLLLTAGASAAERVRGAHPPAGGTTLADGVRRLRAVVVGDARALADPEGAVPAQSTSRSRQARAPREVTTSGAPAPPRNDVVGTPWWDENANWGPDVVRWTERTAMPIVAEAGDTVVVPTPDLPATLPTVLRERGVHWQGEGSTALLGGGRAVLLAPGSAVITAVTPVGIVHTPVTVRPVVRGRVYGLGPNVDGSTNASPLSARIIVHRGRAVDTTWTDVAGRFRLTLPIDADTAPDAPADVRVEYAAPAGAPAARALMPYAPVVLPAVPAARLHMLGVVLLPARWTIASGDFAGTTVPVRAAAARGFWQFTRDHRAPVGWLHDAPHPVAFDAGVDAADQATFWRATRAVEDAWGHSLFIPYAPTASGASSDSTSAEVVVRTVPALRADGLTTLGWDGSGTIGNAAIDFRIASPGTLRPQVVEHELLHALGFGHARGWPSILAPAGRTLAPAPTPADVAYGQLYEALYHEVRRAEREYGAAYGWSDAAP